MTQSQAFVISVPLTITLIATLTANFAAVKFWLITKLVLPVLRVLTSIYLRVQPARARLSSVQLATQLLACVTGASTNLILIAGLFAVSAKASYNLTPLPVHLALTVSF